jgi:hypothetical protein
MWRVHFLSQVASQGIIMARVCPQRMHTGIILMHPNFMVPKHREYCCSFPFIQHNFLYHWDWVLIFISAYNCLESVHNQYVLSFFVTGGVGKE